jgi:hypothetical protein
MTTNDDFSHAPARERLSQRRSVKVRRQSQVCDTAVNLHRAIQQGAYLIPARCGGVEKERK